MGNLPSICTMQGNDTSNLAIHFFFWKIQIESIVTIRDRCIFITFLLTSKWLNRLRIEESSAQNRHKKAKHKFHPKMVSYLESLSLYVAPLLLCKTMTCPSGPEQVWSMTKSSSLLKSSSSSEDESLSGLPLSSSSSSWPPSSLSFPHLENENASVCDIRKYSQPTIGCDRTFRRKLNFHAQLSRIKTGFSPTCWFLYPNPSWKYCCRDDHRAQGWDWGREVDTSGKVL